MTVCTPSGYFFFNDTATTEIYTLSLHDALPISVAGLLLKSGRGGPQSRLDRPGAQHPDLSRHAASRDCAQQQTYRDRSEEHTSELQSRQYLVCRLLLEKKKIEHRSLRPRPLTLI